MLLVIPRRSQRIGAIMFLIVVAFIPWRSEVVVKPVSGSGVRVSANRENARLIVRTNVWF